MKDIRTELDHVDDPDVIERAKGNRALAAALDLSRPHNWAGTGLKPEQLLPIAEESAIPIAWVPPADVLVALAGMPEPGRLRELEQRTEEVIASCQVRVRECRDEWISDYSRLLLRAVDTFVAGFHEAAMALAVSVGEPLAQWASVPRICAYESKDAQQKWETFAAAPKNRYKLAELELSQSSPFLQSQAFNIPRKALIAPIPRFYTAFYPGSGQPVPETVSRHAVAHEPTVEHFSRVNALLAIMLATSILRDMQAWCIDVRIDDAMATGASN